MRYGILGDIHSNLTALEKALEVLEAARVDEIISVGDVVGYGAAPSACIQRLIELDATVVQGNHDAACGNVLDASYFNRYARAAVEWTREQLSPDETEWLAQLPLDADLEHCHVAHGTLADPGNFDYLLGVESARSSIQEMTLPLCFVGHSHLPITVLEPREAVGRLGYSPDSVIDLNGIRRAIVNVGSVGQPRDEDPRLAVGIYDADTHVVTIERHEYAIEVEARRILDAGLPKILADRLWLGI
jgi:diadenosine tetraphosphatase ApaH/serine/threonine PP2A family protein phosphatase